MLRRQGARGGSGRGLSATVLLLSLLVAACAGAGASASVSSAGPATLQTAPATSSTSMTTAPSPSALDARDADTGGVVVIGHSGATGADSDPARPGLDARENSWATGTNPAVDSIYLRLAAADPTLTGHANNYAISGSDVVSLITQAEQAVTTNPMPSLVLVQSIDNDIRCDGTDDENYEPYRASLIKVLETLTAGLPDARIFFVDQWADVRTYDRVVFGVNAAHITGDGPCDTVDPTSGNIAPAKEIYLQGLVDDYFNIITETCALYRMCRTDGGANQKMPLEPEDLAPGLDHLAVAGQAKMAAIEYEALKASGY